MGGGGRGAGPRTRPGKGQGTRPAHWVRPGQQFTCSDRQNALHTATLQADNQPIHVLDINSAYPDSHAYWYRLKGR